MPSPNQSFCPAPWIHSHVDIFGFRKICCISKPVNTLTEDLQKDFLPFLGFEEFWNGPFLSSIRKKMLRGEEVPECENCFMAGNNSSSYRNYFLATNKQVFPDIQARTDDQGKTSLRPVSLDLRISHHCNFKCRMCLPSSSSAILREDELIQEDPEALRLTGDFLALLRPFQKDVVEKEFILSTDQGQIREIYWTGGEPLLIPYHWQVMRKLVEEQKSRQIHVRYNTNLSMITYRGSDLFDLLSHFKSYALQVSIDGTGRVGEFIRTGLHWNRWMENFLSALENSRKTNNRLNLDITLTIPGLLFLPDLFAFALRHEVPVGIKCAFLENPWNVLSPYALPKDLLHEIIEDVLQALTGIFHDLPHSRHRRICRSIRDSFFSLLQGMKTHPCLREIFPDTWKEGQKKAKKSWQKRAEIRGDGKDGRLSFSEIYSINPKVLSWWQEIES